MTQTRAHSFLESITNTAVGYVINLTAQVLIFPVFGIYVPLRTNIGISLFFTVISIARGYALRRWFTGKTEARA